MYRVTYKMAREPDRKYEKVICRKPTGNYKKEFRVYFCDTCNRAWEIDTSVKSSFVVLYYRDFPKLSLEKIECVDCKTKKAQNSMKIELKNIRNKTWDSLGVEILELEKVFDSVIMELIFDKTAIDVDNFVQMTIFEEICLL